MPPLLESPEKRDEKRGLNKIIRMGRERRSYNADVHPTVSLSSRLLKNAHLLRCPHPSSLRSTPKYISLLRISGALHLDIFEQPVQNSFPATLPTTSYSFCLVATPANYFNSLLYSISNHMAKKRDWRPEIAKKAANSALVASTGPTNNLKMRRYTPKIIPIGVRINPRR